MFFSRMVSYLLQWDLVEAIIQLPRDTEIKGKCWNNESELHLSWLDKAYTLKLFFVKVTNTTAAQGSIIECCELLMT